MLTGLGNGLPPQGGHSASGSSGCDGCAPPTPRIRAGSGPRAGARAAAPVPASTPHRAASGRPALAAPIRGRGDRGPRLPCPRAPCFPSRPCAQLGVPPTTARAAAQRGRPEPPPQTGAWDGPAAPPERERRDQRDRTAAPQTRKERKDAKGIRRENRGVALPLSADDMVLSTESPRDAARTRRETMSGFGQVSGYKIDVQNLPAFLRVNNELSGKEVGK